MATAPPSLTPLGTPPTTADPVNFDSRMDAFLSGLPTLQTEQNALSTNVYANAVEAFNSATASTSSAASAAASSVIASGAAGVVMWINKTWAIGEKAYSPINGRVYRRLTAGGGATDPGADPTNWRIDNTAALISQAVIGTTQAAVAGFDYLLVNVAATTVTLPASPLDGDQVAVTPANNIKTNQIDSGTVTVRGPNGTALGIFTLDLGARMQLIYLSTLTAWVVV